MSMTSVVLLLGSNDVEAAHIVERAITIIDASVGKVVKHSEEYRSVAYGFTSKREFVNRAVEIATSYDASSIPTNTAIGNNESRGDGRFFVSFILVYLSMLECKIFGMQISQ